MNPYQRADCVRETGRMDEAVRRAIEAGEDALTDAHAHAPLPEVAEWDALSEIVVKALIRAGWGPVRTFTDLLAEVLVTDHVWYGEPEDGHVEDCAGCALEQRIREALVPDGTGAPE